MPNDCVTVIKRLIYMLDLILLMESHRTERDWSTSTKDNISFTCQCQGVTSQTRCSRCHSLDSATASTLFFEDALVKRNPDVYTSSIFTPVIGNTLFSAIRSIKRRSTPFGYVRDAMKTWGSHRARPAPPCLFTFTRRSSTDHVTVLR